MSLLQSLKIISKEIINKALTIKRHVISHLIATALILTFSIIIDSSLSFKNIMTFAMVLFCGIFIDIDHLSLARLKKLRQQDNKPLKNWVNYLHTWQAGVLILGLSIYFSIYLPPIAYIIHILIDVNNKSSEILGNSPLPEFLYRLKDKKISQ